MLVCVLTKLLSYRSFKPSRATERQISRLTCQKQRRAKFTCLLEDWTEQYSIKHWSCIKKCEIYYQGKQDKRIHIEFCATSIFKKMSEDT